MSRKKPFSLKKYDRILAVVPEFCSGPGWSNTPIWIYVLMAGTKDIKSYCIQPEHQTDAMHTLFSTAAALQNELQREVARVFGGSR